MAEQRYFTGARRLAYDRSEGRQPGVVFLGGFNSNKEGTKALHLEGWARGAGRAFLRFDYSGHGASEGAFRDGTIGDWAEDAAAVLEGLTEGPRVLVGSSMGGWIALLLARRMPERVAGLVTIAAAPDFTEEIYRRGFDEAQRARLERDGVVEVPSDYGDGPYVITRRLIEEAREHLILDAPIRLHVPARFLHGTADASVPVATAQRLFELAEGADIRLTLVKGADHRFSTPECLDLIAASVDGIAPLAGL